MDRQYRPVRNKSKKAFSKYKIQLVSNEDPLCHHLAGSIFFCLIGDSNSSTPTLWPCAKPPASPCGLSTVGVARAVGRESGRGGGGGETVAEVPALDDRIDSSCGLGALPGGSLGLQSSPLIASCCHTDLLWVPLGGLVLAHH